MTVGMRLCFENQDAFTCMLLQQEYNVSFGEAIRMWFSSKTRGMIHNDKGIDFSYVSPARCVDEYILEQENDPDWFNCDF